MSDRMTLGRTGIEVSDYCLGTMTWGNQTGEADAHAQIDRALDAGIDFMDTAEMYPTQPVRRETLGRTEEIIGSWIARGGDRNAWIIATKATGEGGKARDGEPITGDAVRRAVEGSLRRLGTGHIDLYQFHWPNRGSYHFRKYWRFDPSKQPATDSIRAEMDEVAGVLGELVAEGKIRAFGLSNDSAWGTMQWLAAAGRNGGPRVATMQNEYSLLCRIYDTDMAELSCREDVTLLAFSPLAAGLLTGKYQNGQVPEGSRMSLTPDLGGRTTATGRVEAAVAAYLEIAERHGLHPVALALAFCRSRPFPTIPIFGATTMDQLEIALAAREVRLGEDALAEIDRAHRAHAMPI